MTRYIRPLRVAAAGPAGTLVTMGSSRVVVEVTAWPADPGAPVTGEHLLRGLPADGSSESCGPFATSVSIRWRRGGGGLR